MMLCRRVSLSAVLAVLCVALLCFAPVTRGQHAGCGIIVGSPSPAGFTVQPHTMPAETTFAFGTFTATSPVASFNSFGFQFALPEQESSTVPNKFVFAIYDVTSGRLIMQSGSVTPTGTAAQTISVSILSSNPGVVVEGGTYQLAVFSTKDYKYLANSDASQSAVTITGYDVIGLDGFPQFLDGAISTGHSTLLPVAFEGCVSSSFVGDPVLTGFNGQRFMVKGLPGRVYNVLTLPALQLNTRFIPLTAKQAMNSTAQSSVRARQSKLLAALGDNGRADGAGVSNRLPSTASWSHDGLYMGETAVQLAGHRLLVKPGAYVDGFHTMQLDGVEVAVSAEPVALPGGSSIHRTSSSVLEVATAEVSFTLVNSDHFLNIHSALLHILQSEVEHVDGLLGQTADKSFVVVNTAAFKRHVEKDFLLPAADDDLWSAAFERNRFVAVNTA